MCRSVLFPLDRAWSEFIVCYKESGLIKMERGKEDEKAFDDKFASRFAGRMCNHIRSIE
jgi:hypothetical protein